jgi:trafficking protein particle complex subunit 13
MLVIHVGETFTAYLGVVNVSRNLMIRRLTVAAQLQTPSQRWALPSSLDSTNGVDVKAGDCVDAIISKALEESGQHILRVEVGYLTSEGSVKTLRKFYRFNVSNPLTVSERTVRSGDNACLVSITIENTSQSAMVITAANIEPKTGLQSVRIGNDSFSKPETLTASELFDGCGFLEPKSSFQYLFQVVCIETVNARGIACGDELGVAVFEWSKTMGETGRYVSGPIVCPMIQPPGIAENVASKISMGVGNDFIVHGTGISVDVAKVAASREAGKPISNLDEYLSVTVEPIDPPSKMSLAKPQEVKFLVVNHTPNPLTVQMQFRLDNMSGIAVCGKSYKNLGNIAANGGSVVEKVCFLPLVAGLLRVQGCYIVDSSSKKEIPQPPMFHVFVEQSNLQ